MKRLIKTRGFTLIELLMTIVIIGIVSIPISLLIGEQFESYLASQDYSIALNLARLEMAIVTNIGFDNVPIGTTTTVNYKGYDYDLTRTVSYSYGSFSSIESLKEIRVEVKRAGSSDVLVTLVTFLGNNVNYGV